jgi:KaiC/GvpD/RAD55 family RecA-like ATPase
MPDVREKSGRLVRQLVENATIASQCVASILLAAERVLRHGRIGPPRADRLRAEDLSSKQFFERLGDQRQSTKLREQLSGLRLRDESLDENEDRLGRLVLQAWASETNARAARRPDVLALACQLLTNPAVPQTYEAVRYSLVLALRGLYGCRYTAEDLEALRRAYDRLRARFMTQQRRRQPKTAEPFETFLIDLLSLEGWIRRSATRSNLTAYYESFERYPFGIHNRQRDFAEGVWPELTIKGAFPDFPTLLNVAFTQPLSLPGFDDVTGGFMPAIPVPNHSTVNQSAPSTVNGPQTGVGSLVTLIAGPPGSGKTSLCLALTSRMAELGSLVRYVATEELKHSLETKVQAISEPGAWSWWRFSASDLRAFQGDLKILDGSELRTLESLTNNLAAALDGADTAAEYHPAGIELYPVFPRVIVIDSLTTLLESHAQERPVDDRRAALNLVLNKLRKLGVCVFLVGGQQDLEKYGLDYLVDNIFTLDFEEERSRRHSIRVFNVHKTRLQTSDRGRHVWHLSRHEGCTISPSLHSVLRSLRGRATYSSDPKRRAVLWSRGSGRYEQRLLPGVKSRFDEALHIRDRAQVVVYGSGSAGKAALALSIACEPRKDIRPRDEWASYVETHADDKRELQAFEHDSLHQLQVLVVSFLYGVDYYHAIAQRLFRKRFEVGTGRSRKFAREKVKVLAFYPGYIDPESIVARVRRELNAARLAGRRYTAVVIDGIHNLLLQFPLAQSEVLLWPTLHRLLRAEGVTTISTFTFFRAAHLMPTEGRTWEWALSTTDFLRLGPTAAEELFFHLLVASCDYTFAVERPDDINVESSRNWVRVRLASSVDGFGREPRDYWWDNEELTYRQSLGS